MYWRKKIKLINLGSERVEFLFVPKTFWLKINEWDDKSIFHVDFSCECGPYCCVTKDVRIVSLEAVLPIWITDLQNLHLRCINFFFFQYLTLFLS